nr:GAF domain-containing protein [Mycobacterium sp.]
MIYREPRRVDDAHTEERWEGFRDRMAQAGFRSCLALPVPTQRHPRVGFTLLAGSPHQFGDHVLDLVLLFALQGGAAVDNAALSGDARQLIDQLHEALATRETIGRA